MTSLLAAGLELMLIGMGTVFVFLTVLVIATQIMSALVMRWTSETTTLAVSAGYTEEVDEEVDEEEIAAISIALAEHRRRRSQR